jgi:hypothetical protein
VLEPAIYEIMGLWVVVSSGRGSDWDERAGGSLGRSVGVWRRIGGSGSSGKSIPWEGLRGSVSLGALGDMFRDG